MVKATTKTVTVEARPDGGDSGGSSGGSGKYDGIDSMDDHGGWGEMKVQLILSSKSVCYMVRKAADEAGRKVGARFSEMRKTIIDSITKVDWRSIRNFVKASRSPHVARPSSALIDVSTFTQASVPSVLLALPSARPERVCQRFPACSLLFRV